MSEQPKSQKAIAWRDADGVWHIRPKGHEGAPAMMTPDGLKGSMQAAREAESIFELDASEARGRSMKSRHSAPFDEQLAKEVLYAIRELEQAYSKMAWIRSKLLDTDRHPLDASQDLAFLIAAKEQGLQIEDRGPPVDLAFRKLRENLLGHRFKPETQVGLNGGKLAFFTPRSEPTPSHVHAMGHEERQRWEHGGRASADQPNLAQMDYAQLELRVMAKAIADLGLAEWYHELVELVCFPDVDDFLYVRNTIQEHLNDDRVKFLREPDAPPQRDKGESEDDRDR